MKYTQRAVFVFLGILFIFFYIYNENAKNTPLVIHPTGGLSNRLRVLFSYYKEASKHNKNMIVVWTRDSECDGLFLEYFRPIRNVTFVENTDYNIDYKGYNIHPNYNEHTECIYKYLVMQPWLKEDIAQKRMHMGNYIATHIRRTDHSALAKKANMYTTDDDFINFLDASSENIYIATDNKQTYDLFKQKYGDRILHSYPDAIQENALRITNLKESIIDLYMCVYANQFKGSGYSSFSDLIYVLRRCIRGL